MKKKTLFFAASIIVCCAITIIKNKSISSAHSIFTANIEALTQRESDGTYISNSELKNENKWGMEYAFIEGMYVPIPAVYPITCCRASNSYNRCELSYHDSRC